MTLEQLRIFIVVAELEHVTRAAARLNLTQSATSAAIAALEARHGTPLFDRVGRRIALTAAGRAFLPAARAVLAEAAAAEGVLADLAGLARGHITLAASQTVGGYWLPPRLLRFRRACPAVTLDLRMTNTEGAAALVREGQADLALVEGAVDDAALTSAILAEDRMMLVAAPDLALGPEMAAWPWLLREPGSGSRALLERALATRGLALAGLDIVLELPSNEAVRAAVLAGGGVALLSAAVVACDLDAGSLRRLDLDVPARHFHLLRHRERSPARAVSALIDLLKPKA